MGIGRNLALNSLGGVEDDLVCPICNKILENPLILRCQHVFCATCIKHAIKNSECEKGQYKCPGRENYLYELLWKLS